VKLSELTTRLESYLALRRAMGFPMKFQEPRLRDFIAFVEANGASEGIPAQLAVDWACSSPGGIGIRASRLGVARGLLMYLSASMPGIEVPERGLLARWRRPKPYLFSPLETGRLVEGASRLKPEDTLWRHTVSTVIGLVASTGIRSKEALKLTLADVQLDMDPPRLLIREAKFHKSRLVPLHATTAGKLREYAGLRHRLGYDGKCDAFFVSEKRKHVTYNSVWKAVQSLVAEMGIQPQPSSGRWPGLHCLRHTFAVQRLLAWCEQGLDVKALLPNLSVYLGHVRPADTYWYLTATPGLLTTAAQRFADYATPEVER
jgi:integrase